jgi:hypothetical protein
LVRNGSGGTIFSAKAIHRAKINKSYESKPSVPTGETGEQHPSLDQYKMMMAEAERLQLTGEPGSIAQIFSRLYQRKGQLVPGPDDNKGNDKSVVLMKPEKQTEQRMRTSKTYNANQRPMALPGDEGFSFWKA